MVAVYLIISLFSFTAFAGESLSLEKWNRLKSYVAVHNEQVIKYLDKKPDGTSRFLFLANSPIGLLVGTEDITKDSKGNISTNMWHFVATVEEGKFVRTLHRIVVKDSANGILNIENLTATDEQNLAKFEELKNEIHDRVYKIASSFKSPKNK